MTLKIELGRPTCRWIRLRMACGDQSFDAQISSVPDDSITALVNGLISVARGVDDVAVPLCLEPERYEMLFVQETDVTVVVHVTSHSCSSKPADKSRLVFECIAKRREMCMVFWRALRQLETAMSAAEYAAAWGHAFPSEALAKLRASVEA